MKSLFLDTTVAKEAKVTISENGRQLVEVVKDSPLPAVVEALEKSGLELREIDSFKANPGPGSYTGIRVGLAVINTLNWSLGKKTKPLKPVYS